MRERRCGEDAAALRSANEVRSEPLGDEAVILDLARDACSCGVAFAADLHTSMIENYAYILGHTLHSAHDHSRKSRSRGMTT